MIARCETCQGVVPAQAMDAVLTVEQIRFYLRELRILGAPDEALDPLRDWGRSLRRCTCREEVDMGI